MASTGVTTNVSGVVTTVTRNSSVTSGNVTQVSGVDSSERSGSVVVSWRGGKGRGRFLAYHSASELGRQ